MIERLSTAHRSALHALEAAARSGASPRQLDDALADDQAYLVGAWRGDLLVGYALVARLPFDAELQAIGVTPDSRGQGIGRRLLEEVVAVATRWQSERLLLEVRAGNRHAIALYQQAAFREEGRRKGYYPAATGTTGREDALLMSRPLV